jgi:hypothetical protein
VRKRAFELLRPPSALIDELSAELVTDPPSELALARPARRENDGEFMGNFGVFGDDLDAAIRHVRDHAVARQPARRELYLGKASAHPTFASAAIR